MKRGDAGFAVRFLIYLYLALPTLIFLIGWLKWYWALPFGGLAAIACVKSLSEPGIEDDFIPTREDMAVFLKALMVIVLWVYVSGIGGWCYQHSDHEVRNAIFRALVEYDWPVVSHDGSRGLVYYIGFWLPAACIGKLFGLEAGNAAQVIWAVMGVFIVYYLICVHRKKAELWTLIFLIFFSGLDYAGSWLLGESGTDLKLALHLEWWATDFQFTSMTAQLFCVFNQAIPAWVGTMLVLTRKNCKNLLFILSFMMVTSTFPFVGLIPIVIFLYVKRTLENREFWKEAFTFQNMVGVFVIGGCMFLYLNGPMMLLPDSASEEIAVMEDSGAFLIEEADIEPDDGAAVMDETGIESESIVAVQDAVAEETVPEPVNEPAANALRYLLFLFLEAGVFVYFIWKYQKKNPLLYLIMIILILCPFIKIRSDYDFCMRASIPSLLILMLMSMDAWEKIRLEGKKQLMLAYTIVLMLGGLTAFNEIHRSIYHTYWKATNHETVRYPEIEIENGLFQRSFFSGNVRENIFYRYFADDSRIFETDIYSRE